MVWHLYLSVSWLLAGVGILVWHALDPAEMRGKLAGISLGWFALLMGFWSLARWWSYRAALANRRLEREAQAQRQRRPRGESVPDPNSPFKFDEPS